jgi:hypothetical protein
MDGVEDPRRTDLAPDTELANYACADFEIRPRESVPGRIGKHRGSLKTGEIGSLFERVLTVGLVKATLSATVGHVHRQFQAAPDSKFVKCAAQMILDYVFAGADDFANFAVGKAFPDQNRNLPFLRIETLARRHDGTFIFVSIASQLHSFVTLVDSGSQKQHAEVLFYSSLTDIQLASNFLIAEALHEQVQDLLFAGCDFDFIEVSHNLFLLWGT